MAAKWEYRLVSSLEVEKPGMFKARRIEDIEAYLNKLGEDGWQMVNAHFAEGTTDPTVFYAVMMRPKGEATA
ncbi:MAG: DUF4177 domain-containing protein [Candidatus Schekmanbacteria bacterium]|nr:DUF4177 domain-containing protein [Candidatus Schekmanbacteria bacterium]